MNKTTTIIIGAIIIAGVSFFTGTKFSGGVNSNQKNISADFSGRMGQFSGTGIGGQRMNRAGGSFISGEILSRDNNSITIKDNSGGSKIVFLTSSTTVMKTDKGLMSDLISGVPVTVSGSSNSDGSINADSIQIRSVAR